MLSEIQKHKYLEISGHEYTGEKLNDRFRTMLAYNENKWKSPWVFTYIIEPELGYLICELDHRLTDNRIYGWNREGHELPKEITHKYFTQHS